MFFSLKSIKYEYQHCTYSSNGSISIDISIFRGARFKIAPGAVRKWSPISKKIGFSIFLAKGKNLTPRQVEIPTALMSMNQTLLRLSDHTNAAHPYFGFCLQVFRHAGPPQRANFPWEKCEK